MHQVLQYSKLYLNEMLKIGDILTHFVKSLARFSFITFPSIFQQNVSSFEDSHVKFVKNSNLTHMHGVSIYKMSCKTSKLDTDFK